MVNSIFLYPVSGAFDVEAIRGPLSRKPDVLIDPLGSGTYMLCGVPEAVPLKREKRCAKPSEFPYCVTVTVEPDVVNIFQEYGNAWELRSAREFAQWVLDHYECRIEDEYQNDLTTEYKEKGVGVLYPPTL
jgi:hypothetical protein